MRIPFPVAGANPVSGGSEMALSLKSAIKAVVAARGTVAADSKDVLGPIWKVVFA